MVVSGNERRVEAGEEIKTKKGRNRRKHREYKPAEEKYEKNKSIRTKRETKRVTNEHERTKK